MGRTKVIFANFLRDVISSEGNIGGSAISPPPPPSGDSGASNVHSVVLEASFSPPHVRNDAIEGIFLTFIHFA